MVMMKAIVGIAAWFGVRRSVGLLLLAGLTALRIWDPPLLEELRVRSFDFYQVLKPRNAAFRPVVIVDIDEESLKALGQWPWPRTLLADLVNRLKALGSVAIGFDIVFPEPDRMSPGMVARSFRDLDPETRAKLQDLPSNDQIFAEAIRGGRVILGQSGVGTEPPEHAGTKWPQTGFAAMGADPTPYLVTYPSLLRNVFELEEAAAGRGLFSIRAERDGIVRRVPIVMRAADIMVPALSLEMLRVVTNAGAILVKTDEAGISGVGLPGLQLPTDRNGQLWVNFAPHDRARYVSAKDVLSGAVTADRISGKLILIGTSAVGLLDIRTTPLDPVLPGVEVHAQMLEGVLTNAMLSYPNYAPVLELVAAMTVSLAVIVLAPIVGALALLVLGTFVAAGVAGLSWYSYTAEGVLLDATYPLLSSLVIYAVLVFISYFREQTDRRRIRSAFGQYLSPHYVELLAQSPGKLALGGEEKTMTILFSDVRGFTSISELYKHDPQGLTHLMNRLLTPLTNAIIDRKGTIDKYMGDAIMAFWNAPLDDPDHEINACSAALEMLRRIDVLNREREQEALQNGTPFIPMHVGIGINTGRCIVGNMGSDLRFDYTVLGDSVNLASRLEGRSKSYGTPIIVGSATAQKANGRFATLELDLITVKGKEEPEHIFTILGNEDVARSDDFRKLAELNTRMLTCYRKRDWAGALEALQLCRYAPDNFGLDEIYALYLARIEGFRNTPPPDDWDGVYAFDTK
jgi:adenylate cyclase